MHWHSDLFSHKSASAPRLYFMLCVCVCVCVTACAQSVGASVAWLSGVHEWTFTADSTKHAVVGVVPADWRTWNAGQRNFAVCLFASCSFCLSLFLFLFLFPLSVSLFVHKGGFIGYRTLGWAVNLSTGKKCFDGNKANESDYCERMSLPTHTLSCCSVPPLKC